MSVLIFGPRATIANRERLQNAPCALELPFAFKSMLSRDAREMSYLFQYLRDRGESRVPYNTPSFRRAVKAAINRGSSQCKQSKTLQDKKDSMKAKAQALALDVRSCVGEGGVSGAPAVRARDLLCGPQALGPEWQAPTRQVRQTIRQQEVHIHKATGIDTF